MRALGHDSLRRFHMNEGHASLLPLALLDERARRAARASFTREHLEDVEFATLEWVEWFNNRRLLGPIGSVPPAEFEESYHQQQSKAPAELALT